MMKHLLIACCAIFFLLFGCAGLKEPDTHLKMPTPAIDPVSVVSFLEKINHDLSSIKGIGRIKIWNMGRLQSTRVAWAGFRSEKLRLEVLGVGGRPLSSVAFDGNHFYLSLHAESQFFQKQTRHADLKRLIFIPLPVKDALTILSGRVPLLSKASARLEKEPADNRYVLTMTKGWLNKRTAKIYLQPDMQTVWKYELYGANNKLRYRVEYLQRKQYGTYQLPVTLLFSDDHDTRIQIDADRLWPNAELKSTTFDLRPPG